MGTIKKKGIYLGIFVFLMILIVGFVFAFGFKHDKTTDHSGELSDVTIETPYCTLYYPGRWESYLNVKMVDEVVRFYANIDKIKELHLFDISFVATDGERQGKIIGKNGVEVEVFVKISPIMLNDSWSEESVDVVYAMQEGINYVLDRITFLEEVTEETSLVPVTQETIQADYEDLVFEFPYGQLYFPGQWAEQVRFEYHEGDLETAVLYGTIGHHSETPLFEIVFGEVTPSDIGVFTTAEGKQFGVGVFLHQFEMDESWSQDERESFLLMQESVNYVLDKMNLSTPVVEDYSEMPVEEDITESENLVVETPYVQLQYPGKWKDYLRVECTGEKSCTVTFYGKIASYEEQMLFAICFNDMERESIGMIRTSDGMEIPVSLIYEDLLFEPNIAREAMDVYYAMQEDVNFLLSELLLQ